MQDTYPAQLLLHFHLLNCNLPQCGLQGLPAAVGAGLCLVLPFGLTVGRFCFPLPFAVCLSPFLPLLPCAYAKHIAAHYLTGINMLSLARAGASCCSRSLCSLLLPLLVLLVIVSSAAALLLLLLLMNLLLFLLLPLLIFALRLLWFYVAHNFLFFCQTLLGNPSKGGGETWETVARWVPSAVSDFATNSLQ